MFDVSALAARAFSRTRKAAPAAAVKSRFYDGMAPTYLYPVGKPVWTNRDYDKFADEAYVKNVIAHRCIGMIATGAASVPFTVTGQDENAVARLRALLSAPNPAQGGGAFIEAAISYYLISGNIFMQAVGPRGDTPRELHLLRPDRVQVIAGNGSLPAGYRHNVSQKHTDFPVDRVTGRSQVLHIKRFHPLNDWYGLSPIEAAAYSIDQHNQAGAWNQALLQNGARPSGALVVTKKDGPGTLSEEQYTRLKGQMDEQFSGPGNAGRPILLEGGLDWKEMSLSPKDMDFIEAKNSSARDIALAFGVPPQLLGIPGDNTYSNLAEARLSLWEQTILPVLGNLCSGVNNWLGPVFAGAVIACDTDGIPALAARRESMWAKVQAADFLTREEKRKLVGVE